jgi:ring-1,2-phenylacetyl-CoA epoxidase subunit PaaE
MAVAFHRLEIVDVRRETPEAVSLAFAVPPDLADAYRFSPGQHLTLRAMMDGAEVRRSYSISSGLDDGELRVVVKKVEGGLFSCFINERVESGDQIEVMTPQGRFGILPDASAARNYLAIAAGSGITPVMSIVRSVLAREPKGRLVLIYGNRTAQSIIFKEQLEDLKDRFVDRISIYHVLSREKQEIALLNGRIDGEKIATVLRTIIPASLLDHVFLCGPGGLIEDSRTTLQTLGVPAERIHVEYFTVEGMPAATRASQSPRREETSKAAAIVRVRLAGSEHVVPLHNGETIVAAGLRHGLEMPYSCRGGMCCTCRAMLLEGEVTMDQNYSLERWEMEAGYVLTCQSHPKTAMVAVDYDRV